MNLTVDDQKVRVYVELERKVGKLKEEKDKLEKAVQVSQESYNNAKYAAFQGQASWDGAGATHIAYLKLQREFENTSNAHSAANNDLSNAKHVVVEELLRAARAAVV